MIFCFNVVRLSKTLNSRKWHFQSQLIPSLKKKNNNHQPYTINAYNLNTTIQLNKWRKYMCSFCLEPIILFFVFYISPFIITFAAKREIINFRMLIVAVQVNVLFLSIEEIDKYQDKDIPMWHCPISLPKYYVM